MAKAKFVPRHLGKKIPNAPENRFKLKCSAPTPSGCIMWTAYCKPNGYGQFFANGRHIYAHRFSYENHYKIPIPEGAVVCHKCDNPGCVNPEHLFLASQAGNNADAIRKKRNAWSKRPILTQDQRREVYFLIKECIPVREVMKKYGISKSSCYNIFNKESSTHENTED